MSLSTSHNAIIRKILTLLILGLFVIPYSSAQQQDNLGPASQDYKQVGAEQANAILQSIGVSGSSGFSTAKIIAWLIFGAVGFIGFCYGKKQGSFKPLVIGLCLMGYPYFIFDTFWLYAVGIGFCLALYFWRD